MEANANIQGGWGGEQATAANGWRDHGIRSAAPDELDVLFLAGGGPDFDLRSQLPNRQTNENASLVVVRNNDRVIGFLDCRVTQHLLRCGIAQQEVNAKPIGLLQSFRRGVDDDDLADVGLALQQFLHSGAPLYAESADDDVPIERVFQLLHFNPFDRATKNKFVRGSQEDHPYENAERRNAKSDDRTSLEGDGHDVPVPERGDGDHREIQDVERPQMATTVIADAVPGESKHQPSDGHENHQDGCPREQSFEGGLGGEIKAARVGSRGHELTIAELRVPDPTPRKRLHWASGAGKPR